MTEAQIIAAIAAFWAFWLLFRSTRAVVRFAWDFVAGIGQGMREEAVRLWRN